MSDLQTIVNYNNIEIHSRVNELISRKILFSILRTVLNSKNNSDISYKERNMN